MKTFGFKAFYLVFLVAIMASCVIPTTKDAYLNNFGRFVRDVEKSGEKFSLSDWRWANNRFGKYTGEWYDKFSGELSADEKSEINGLTVRYLTVRGKNRFSRFFRDNFGKELDRIKDDVKEYMQKDFQQDMKDLGKGAREIGDSAKKVVEDIIKKDKD